MQYVYDNTNSIKNRRETTGMVRPSSENAREKNSQNSLQNEDKRGKKQRETQKNLTR